MIKRVGGLTSNSTENPGAEGVDPRIGEGRAGGGGGSEIEKRFIRKKDDSRDASLSWLIP